MKPFTVDILVGMFTFNSPLALGAQQNRSFEQDGGRDRKTAAARYSNNAVG